jgi:folate-binding protein YgfZ
VTEPFAQWIERDVIRAHGPDAASYLQGQISQDVDAIAVGDTRWTLLLNPAGKVDAWLRMTRTGDDEFTLDTDGGWGGPTLARLTRFKLRTKVDFDAVAGWRCLAVRGTVLDDPTAHPIVWPGIAGVDLLGPDVEPPTDVPLADHYERTRIEAGVPAMGRELTEATIPVEAGQWLIDASVSFTKGCYTGQELVARINSRGGNAPRPVRGLRIGGEVGPGAAVVGDDGRALGELTSALYAADLDETIALAPLARAVAPPADVTVAGRPARLVELPMT